ncbi:hypothetical protein HN51_071252 [Arachis hypogaea]
MKLLFVSFLTIPAFCNSRFQGGRCHVEFSFMFERGNTHLGAIELLGERFSSPRKKDKPVLPARSSCMHYKLYQQQHATFHCYCWQPSLIAQRADL